ncbi:hypothetical protein AUP68_14219 [Ilyonectria robusta]
MSDNTYSTIHTSGGPFGEFDIVPLTTVWSPPDGCPSIVTFGGFATITLSCYPPDYESLWYNYGFYSPGICPSGYTSGCTPTDTDYGGPIRPTETAAVCVPSSYSCSDFLLHAISTSGDNTVSVPAFQIRWAESDLSALETPPVENTDESSTSRSTVTVISETSTASQSSSTTSVGSGSSSNSSLSTGAVVGIAIGSAAVVAIIAAASFFMFRRRVTASQKGPGPSWQDQPHSGMAELDTPAQHVSTVDVPKPPRGASTVAELGHDGKYMPQAGYTSGGVPYIPTHAHGGGMPPELPHDGRIAEHGGHASHGMGVRHELGVQERPVVEMYGSSPQPGYTRQEMS